MEFPRENSRRISKKGVERDENNSVTSNNRDQISAIAGRMNLREGEEAIRRLLRIVFISGKIGTKNLAQASRLPTQVVAAIRRELEKEGLLMRRGGAVLTEYGEEVVREGLGITKAEDLTCPKCNGKKISIKKEHLGLLEILRKYSSFRPEPDSQIDQAYATPETAMRRALYMFNEGDLDGRNVLFLGDDDLTSVAAGLLNVTKSLTVLDIDERLLQSIEEISDLEDLNIVCIQHDLMNPLTPELVESFDVIFTDPPYTVPGLNLFLSRGIEAIRKRKTANIYLAFADKTPLEMLEVHRAIVNMGLFVTELIPRFNTYEGAEMFANTSFIAKLMVTEATKPSITGIFESKIYTGQIRPTVRFYRCKCGYKIEVGSGKSFNTVEELKARGCPICHIKQGFKLERKIRLTS